jgi:TatD family hydrolase
MLDAVFVARLSLFFHCNIRSEDRSAISLTMSSSTHPRVVDIGINLTNRAFRNQWKDVVRRAIDVGVDRMLLTGTSLEGSRDSLELAQQWQDEEGSSNLYVTVGVHPHDAKTWNDDETLIALKKLLQHPLAVAVGECGLDYNRNYSSKDDQIHAFRQQLQLACVLELPLFVHERDAHDDLVQVLDQVGEQNRLPPIVVHCFTGTEQEALTYIERGYHVGFTGTICKTERGAPLRALLPKLPLEKLMVETDAPFMGFQRGRKRSEPADCVHVARKLSETVGIPFQEVCESTTRTALNFFEIPG